MPSNDLRFFFTKEPINVNFRILHSLHIIHFSIDENSNNPWKLLSGSKKKVSLPDLELFTTKEQCSKLDNDVNPWVYFLWNFLLTQHKKLYICFSVQCRMLYKILLCEFSAAFSCNNCLINYSRFYETLTNSSWQMSWISVKFHEMGVIYKFIL